MADRFGERLKIAREAKGLTGYRVAKDAGLSQPHYHHLETGRRQPSNEALEKLAPVLGVPLDQLKAWARAEGMSEEEQRYLWMDAASSLVRIEAAGREVDRLVAEKRALVQGPKTPEAMKRAGEIDVMLLALKNLMNEEGAKLLAEKARRAEG